MSFISSFFLSPITHMWPCLDYFSRFFPADFILFCSSCLHEFVRFRTFIFNADLVFLAVQFYCLDSFFPVEHVLFLLRSSVA